MTPVKQKKGLIHRDGRKHEKEEKSRFAVNHGNPAFSHNHVFRAPERPAVFRPCFATGLALHGILNH